MVYGKKKRWHESKPNTMKKRRRLRKPRVQKSNKGGGNVEDSKSVPRVIKNRGGGDGLRREEKKAR